MRGTLVRSLYTKPSSLAIGAVNSAAACGLTAWTADNVWLYGAAILISIVGLARIFAAFNIRPDDNKTSTSTLEHIYEIGAFSQAFILGVVAAASVVLEVGIAVEAVMIANALGYGTGTCARNAARPAIAIGQLTLCIMPLLVASLWMGTLPFYFLAFNLFTLILAMVSIGTDIFGVLRESISSAETSERLANKMERLARTDVVTGLSNRAGLNHNLAERLENLSDDKMLALFWMDLDRFKEVNDLFGHQAGDRILAEFAKRMREVSPPDAMISRFGGDEFVMLCEVQSREECHRLAGKVLEHVSRAMRLDSERIEMPCSMGIALLPEDGTDAETLMKCGDMALYEAKVSNRGRAVFYDPSMSRKLVRRREIEAELRAALTRDELSIFFQPIVDLETGRIKTFEALVRWFHPEKGELRPDEFIPVAEETGVIVTLGNWITAQAAKAAAQWPEDVTIAVNLSPLQIKAPGAALGIVNALKSANLDPKRLELEVTESLFLDDSSLTATFIEELSAIGVRFALDDFGTGYSSLGYINKYPFSKIKVDRSFVSGPDVGKKTEAIIRAVAEMGSTLEMSIVAEGLETIEQVRAVRDAGCTLGQGYYFSRAVPDYLAAMLLSQEAEQDGGLKKVS